MLSAFARICLDAIVLRTGRFGVGKGLRSPLSRRSPPAENKTGFDTLKRMAGKRAGEYKGSGSMFRKGVAGGRLTGPVLRGGRRRTHSCVHVLLTGFVAGTLLVSAGCSRSSGKAEALHKKGKGGTATASSRAAASRFRLVPRNSLASRLPASNALVYVSVPDVAAAAFAIGNSPLRKLWQTPALADTVQRYLGLRFWESLKKMAAQVVEGKWRGPLEFAVTATRRSLREVDFQIYLLWRGKEGVDQFVRSLTDCLIALRDRVPGFGFEEKNLPDGTVLRSFTLGGGAMKILFAARDGVARLSTDETFFSSTKPPSGSLQRDPAFITVTQKVAAAGTPLGYVYVSTAHALNLIASQLPVPAFLWERVGLADLKAVGFASHQFRGQVRELLFALWPENRRGMLGPLFRSAKVRAALALVPSGATSFGVGGIDLPDFYEELQSTLARLSGLAGSGFEAQIKALEDKIGVGLKDLLKAFGTDMMNYTVMRGSTPVSVIALSVRNSDIVRRVVGRIGKAMGRELLVESVDAVPVYSLPGPMPVYLAVCEHHVVASTDLPAVRDFIQHRKGRPDPIAARPEVKEILGKRCLSGLSFVRLNRQLGAFAQVTLPQVQQVLQRSPNAPAGLLSLITTLQDLLTVDTGDLWGLTFVGRDGVLYELRSSYGLGPFVLSAGCVAGTVAIPAVMKARQQQRERKVIEEIRTIASGQEAFRMRNGRYAQNLWELGDQMLVDSALARGFKHGYLFKVRSSGSDTWHVDVRPAEGHGRYFWCDQTGVIRAENNKPASSESPVAPGTGG